MAHVTLTGNLRQFTGRRRTQRRCRRRVITLTHRFAASLCAFVLAIALAVGAAPSAIAQEVDLQLVLAVDVSGSVSDERFTLQKEGYARAFRHWRVLEAIRAGPKGAIAVTMTHWTGPTAQMQVVPWMVISDEASMLAFADAVERASRQLYGGGTSISGAIDHAMTLFPQIEAMSGRRVIDVSGDGANNRGRPAAEARDDAMRAGVTINGLPILALEPNLDQYYLDNVIGGPNAFSIVAETFEAFAEAVLKKLITEIAALPLKGRTAAGVRT